MNDGNGNGEKKLSVPLNKMTLEEVSKLCQLTFESNRDCLVAAYFLSHTDVSPEQVQLCQKVIPDEGGIMTLVTWVEKRPLAS